ncbi:hypothetical protein NCER_100012 [Vairimorpha ceranae BRL01]|uniref:Transcription initiation factor IIF subunit beta n=2 Tax=Vairimorpha ceranae TaxID=40302 RepID=C4V6I3_VAIC1|nr:hypothetical protein NCER_100012 [Vairimorpha ceranae BRL01]
MFCSNNKNPLLMEIDDRKKNKKINIVKLPKFLGNYITNLHQQTDIGEVDISDNGNIKFRIYDKSGIGIPLEYNVKQISKNNSDMYVLSNTQILSSIEGEIDSELVVTPIINKKYIEFKKQNAYKVPSTTAIIDSTTEKIRLEKIGNLREMDYLARKRKQMLIDKKRERLDKTEAMNIVFNAFEKYESWTVRDLADFTGQPTAFVQEIVNEICNVDKKEHKSLYTLKNEYK